MIFKINISNVLAFIFLFPFICQAEPKNLNDVLNKATQEEMLDLPKLLNQIKLKPYNNSLKVVTEVEKGSVYDREGIKVGDLIATSGKSNGKKLALRREGVTSVKNQEEPRSPQEAMKLYQKMKEEGLNSAETEEE